MLISGLTPFSMIDYPGELASIIFTPGCNLRCRFCHNPDFVLPDRIEKLDLSEITESDFFSFLEKRRGKLTGVSICGGEPTLQKDLHRFAKQVKDMGFRVKLDTNGQDPEYLLALFRDQLIDYVAMDIKHQWDKYSGLTGLQAAHVFRYKKSQKIIEKYAPDYEFRTTVIGGVHGYEDIFSIVDGLKRPDKYYLQGYREGSNLDPTFSGYAISVPVLSEWRDRLSEHFHTSISLRF